MRRSHTPRRTRHQEWPTCCPPPQDCTPVPFPVDSSPAKLAVTSAGAASVPEPLPLPSRVPASSQGLFRAGTPSRPHASGAQAHRRCLCVTWGVPACPRANQPRVTLLPPPDLHGETDRLILGSWLEWGPCWFSSAVCSRGAGLHVSLGPPSGRTWHVQMCRRWAHSSAGGWAAGPLVRDGEPRACCQALGVRLGKERGAPFRPGTCARGCPPGSHSSIIVFL